MLFPLYILCQFNPAALFFCFGAWFWQQCVLVPMKEEKIVFKATILSAVVNLFFNLIFIPFWKENAAAITTIMAEAIAFLWCWWHVPFSPLILQAPEPKSQKP